MNTERTKGIIDLHIHSAPDVRQRKMNDLELMEAGVKLGARAMVIKSHLVPTMDRDTGQSDPQGEISGFRSGNVWRDCAEPYCRRHQSSCSRSSTETWSN